MASMPVCAPATWCLKRAQQGRQVQPSQTKPTTTRAIATESLVRSDPPSRPPRAARLLRLRRAPTPWQPVALRPSSGLLAGSRLH
jgi:hypothetical protein